MRISKNIFQNPIQLKYFLILMLSLVLISCGDDDTGPAEPTAQERTSALLVGSPWTLQGVTVDGLNRTSAYAGLTVTFTGSAFTSTNGRGIWPASGTWTFANEEATIINRNDGKAITIQTVNQNLLRISMVIDQNSFVTGRTTSLAGTHVLVFERL